MKKPFMPVCFYCGKLLNKDVKFCTYCGKPRKEGEEYNPDDNVTAMLYGPPFNAKYTCPACKTKFKSSGLGFPEKRYCPNCGQQCDCQSGGIGFHDESDDSDYFRLAPIAALTDELSALSDEAKKRK